ncbi:MAG: hypothetical protein IJ511_01815 [Bacteroides sp.]|nr:hypothetical protein [Bacteroides sp.]
MNKKINTFLCYFAVCLFIVSCGNDDENSNQSVVGVWNATCLTEDVIYSDLGKEVHNDVEISYGSYIWNFEEDGSINIKGNDGGSYQWYNTGEKPTDYQTFIFDKNQMKLLFGFSDASKSSIAYDVLQISDTEMVLRETAKWLIVGDGQAIITRTLTFSKIN